MSNASQKLGILGGGQLGRMMIAASEKFGLEYHVLDPDAEAPCRHLSHFTKGSYADYETVMSLGRQVNCLTTEIEHVHTEALALLEKQIPVYPQSDILSCIQDKGLQKEFYAKHGFPTADFALVSHYEENTQYPQLFPAIQKLRRQGYDGRGVLALKTPADLGFTGPSVLEKQIQIAKEISILTCRDQFGKIITYAPVDMTVDPDANLLTYLHSPADLSPTLAHGCIDMAKALADTFGVVGMLAVELMIDTHGKIWINESAPRPHNSGHHTIESASVSQFEQHVRAVIGLPVADLAWEKPAVMCNLLGSAAAGPVYWRGLDEVYKHPEAHLHLYGKKYTKPNRKMGHLTVVDHDLGRAHELLRHLVKQVVCEGASLSDLPYDSGKNNV